MSTSTRLLFGALLPLIAACSHVAAAAPPSVTVAASVDQQDEEDQALSLDKATAALASVPENGTDCRVIAVVGEPITAKHLDNSNAGLQQTVGHARLVSFASDTTSECGPLTLEGNALATIVGKKPSGELLANHHLLFAEGSLRTQNDVVALKPTDDKCIFTSKVTVNFHDGTGEFAGLSGTGTADTTLDFCGGVGRAVIYGRVCKAK